jgi:hypothetical protein
MAQVDLSRSNTKFALEDAQKNPLFTVIEVGEGGTTSFPVICLDVSGVTYYYWPNSSGVLRYGTTVPTTSTQDSAGAAV